MDFGRFRRSVRRNPAVAGLPMLGLCFGGLYALTTFQQGRYERVDFMRKSQTQREFDLEEELEGVLKSMDLEDYEPKPIPDENGTQR
jgi:hypothetical protein